MNLDFNCAACDAGRLHQTWDGKVSLDPCTGWLGMTTLVVEPANIRAAVRMREDLLRDNPFEDRIIGAELFDDPKPGHVEPLCYHVKYSDSTPCRECIALAEPVPLAQERKGGKYTPVEQADGDGGWCDEPDCACHNAEPDSKPEKYSLIPAEFLAELARVMDHGMNKYRGGRIWTEGYPWSMSYDAALRHMEKFRRGEVYDLDSGFQHLVHACARLMFLSIYSTDAQYEHLNDL